MTTVELRKFVKRVKLHMLKSTFGFSRWFRLIWWKEFIRPIGKGGSNGFKESSVVPGITEDDGQQLR